MPEPSARIFAFLMIAMMNLCITNAQTRSIGTTYSYNGISLIYGQVRSDDSFMDFQLQAELGEVFMDRTDMPGLSASFTWNHVLKTWKSSEGNEIRLYAGPGISAGYGNDFRKDAGVFFGMKGKIGIDCHYMRNIRISLALSPVIGCHMTVDGEYHRMACYRNGLMSFIVPEIGICHTF